MSDQTPNLSPEEKKTTEAEQKLHELAEKMYSARKESAEEKEAGPELLNETEKLNREELVKKMQSKQLSDEDTVAVQAHAVDVSRASGAGAQLTKLVNLAHAKGVLYAIEVARKMRDPHLLDALHDMLAKDDNFRQLVEKGKL